MGMTEDRTSVSMARDNANWPNSFGFKLSNHPLVLVTSVQDDTVAQRAGLQPGDQLVELDGHNVQKMSRQNIIRLAQRSQQIPPALVVISRLRKCELRKRSDLGFGFSLRGNGPIFIDQVVKHGPACEAGLYPGDMVVRVNGMKVGGRGISEVEQILEQCNFRLRLVVIIGKLALQRQGTVKEIEHRQMRARAFLKQMNYCLTGEEHKKTFLMSLLKRYSKDKDVENFANILCSLLTTTVQRRLLLVIRKYLTPSHQVQFDQIVKKKWIQKLTPQTMSSSSRIGSPDSRFGYKENWNSKAFPPRGKLQQLGNERLGQQTVQITRGNGSTPFGFTINGSKPVVIKSVDQGGAASVAGLTAGDHLLEINGINVRTLSHEDVTELLKNSGKCPLLLVQWRPLKFCKKEPMERENSKKEDTTTTMNSSLSNVDILETSLSSDSTVILETSSFDAASNEQSSCRPGSRHGLPVIRTMADTCRKEINTLLTKGEQLVIKQCLSKYHQDRNMDALILSLECVLDDPVKLQMLHHIVGLLPSTEQSRFEQLAMKMVAHQTENGVLCSVATDIKDVSELLRTLQVPGKPTLSSQSYIQLNSNGRVLVSDDDSLENEDDLASTHEACLSESAVEALLNVDDTAELNASINGGPTEILAEPVVVAPNEERPSTRNQGILVSELGNPTSSKTESPSTGNASISLTEMQSLEAKLRDASIKVEKFEKLALERDALTRGNTQSLTTPAEDNASGKIGGSGVASTPKNTTRRKLSVSTALPPPPPPPPPPLPPTLTAGPPTGAPLPPAPPPPSPLKAPGGFNISHQNMQLKRMNWEKLSSGSLQNTVWSQLGKSEPLEDLIDYDELEHLFSTTNKTQVAIGEAKDKSSSILESKKAYNLSILLGHLKMPLEDIQKTILAVDDSKLTEPQIRTMLNCAPERLELRALKEYKGDPEKLGLSDKFALKMAAIPNYTERLKAMLFKAKFHERVDEVSPEVECVIDGSTEVKTSKKLARILEIVLATGNYMNRGQTRIAGAYGFRISFLTKLLSTKTTDNKSTLLHVITNTILNKFPELLDVKDELKSVGQAAKVSSQMVGLEMEELKVGMKDIRDGVKATTQKDSLSDDRYKEVMGNFMSEAEAKFARLLSSYDQMRNEFKSACDFFGEDSSKITTEDFFGAFAIFLQHLETTIADLVKEKDKKEDISKKEKETEITVRQRKESRGSSFSGIPPPVDQNELKRSFEAMALKKKQGLVSQKSLDDVKIQRGRKASAKETITDSEPVSHSIITQSDKSKETNVKDRCVLPSSLRRKGTLSPPLMLSSNPCNDGSSKGEEKNEERKRSHPPPPPRRSSSLTRYDLDSAENGLNICHLESSKDKVNNEQTQPSVKHRLGPPPVKPKPAKPVRKKSLPTKFNNSSAWVVSVEKSEEKKDIKQIETDPPTATKAKEEAEKSELPTSHSLPPTANVVNGQEEQTSPQETQGASIYKAIMERFRNSTEDVSKSSFDFDGVSLYSSFVKPRLDKDEAKHIDAQAIVPQAEISVEGGVNFNRCAANNNKEILTTKRVESRECMTKEGTKLAETAVVDLNDKHVERGLDTKNSPLAIPVVLSRKAKDDPLSPTPAQPDCKTFTFQSGNKYFEPSTSSFRKELKKPESPTGQSGIDLSPQSYSALSPRDLPRERSSSSASSTSAEVSSFMNNIPDASQPSVTFTTPEIKPVSILKKGPSPSGKSECHNVKFSSNERQEIEPLKVFDEENNGMESFEKGWSPRTAVNIPPPPSIPPPLPPSDGEEEFVVAKSNHSIIDTVAMKLDSQETFIALGPCASPTSHSLSSNPEIENEPRAQVGGKDEEGKPVEEAVSYPQPQVSSPSAESLAPPSEFSNVGERASPTDARRKISRTHRASPPKELPPPPPPISFLSESNSCFEKGASSFAKEPEHNDCIQNAALLGSDINSLLVSVLPDDFDKGPPSFTPPPPPIDRSNKPRTVSLTSYGSGVNSLSSPTTLTSQPEQNSDTKDINKNVTELDLSLDKSRGSSLSSMSSASSTSLPPPPTDALLDDFEFDEDNFDIGPPPSITPPPPPTQFSSYLTSR